MKKKILNLYGGVGGNRKDWVDVEVTAVEFDPKIAAVYKRLHPFDTVIVGDAHAYLEKHYQEFDIIWSSPPCQSHSKMVKFTRHKSAIKCPDMVIYSEAVFLTHFFKGNWVIENVVPYYDPMMSPKRIGRHLFWSNVDLDTDFELKNPSNFINKANLSGKKEMMDWLGIHYEENIYYKGNHCPAQVLRNCVHPSLGQFVFNQLL